MLQRVAIIAVLLAGCYGLWRFVPVWVAGTLLAEFQILAPAAAIVALLSLAHALLKAARLEK